MWAIIQEIAVIYRLELQHESAAAGNRDRDPSGRAQFNDAKNSVMRGQHMDITKELPPHLG